MKKLAVIISSVAVVGIGGVLGVNAAINSSDEKDEEVKSEEVQANETADTTAEQNEENPEQPEQPDQSELDVEKLKTEMTDYIHNDVQATGRNDIDTVKAIEIDENNAVTYTLWQGTSGNDHMSARVNELLTKTQSVMTKTFETYPQVSKVNVEWVDLFGIDNTEELAVETSLTAEDFANGALDASTEDLPTVFNDYYEHDIYKTYAK